MSLVSSRSLARVSVGVVFTATVTVPLITTAAADTTAGTSSAKSVTVFLKAPNPHGLAALGLPQRPRGVVRRSHAALGIQEQDRAQLRHGQ